MADMLHRRLKRDDYLRFIRDLHAVYAAMERSLDRTRAHPVLAPLRFPELDRAQSLADDLTALHGPDWSTALKPSAAASAYVNRINAAETDHPERLAAHAYVRYLGDLSGGQMLKKLIGESLSLDSGTGLAFYEFPGIPDANAFKQNYRALLDALPLSPEAADGVIAEARDAFLLNMDLAQAATRSPG